MTIKQGQQTSIMDRTNVHNLVTYNFHTLDKKYYSKKKINPWNDCKTFPSNFIGNSTEMLL